MTAKGKFLQRFNEAFAMGDVAFIEQNITDNICWTIIGDKKLEGKEAVTKALQEMNGYNLHKLTVHHVITHGNTAAVDGVIEMTGPSGEEQTYAFCDVYRLSGFKNPKVSQMTSYVVLQ